MQRTAKAREKKCRICWSRFERRPDHMCKRPSRTGFSHNHQPKAKSSSECSIPEQVQIFELSLRCCGFETGSTAPQQIQIYSYTETTVTKLEGVRLLLVQFLQNLTTPSIVGQMNVEADNE